MELGFFTVLGIGILIGLRHSLDADHVVAVSTIATRTKNPMKAGITGVFWGLGHTATIFFLGCIVLFFGISIPEQLDHYFEWIVAVVLIYLGFKTILEVKSQLAATSETSLNKFHRRSFFVGMVHGLAGSAALTLLMVSQITHTGQGVMFLLLFGIGSIIGMFVIAMLLSIPFRALKTVKLQQVILYVVGVLSIGFGISLFFIA
jgi:threonine/homoserine/homoserine lactone efflux protein